MDFCDELVVLSHDGVAGAASDVDAVTGFGGVAEDTLVASWKAAIARHANATVARSAAPAEAGRRTAPRA